VGKETAEGKRGKASLVKAANTIVKGPDVYSLL